ncbi:phosphotransferase [Actinocatenispora rupis]|nr:phosphotransferase [Actinocatenispora rupis]
MSTPRWERAAKLDPSALTARVVAATGIPFEYVGPCAGGEVGAGYVRWPDGHDAVLTWAPGVPGARVEQIGGMLDTARAHGLPVPAYELVVELPGAVALVQQRLPGTVPDRLDEPLVDAMLRVHEGFGGLLAGRDDLPALRLYLREPGPGFCLHEPLAGYDRRTARLLHWVREVGVTVPDVVAGDDLVHGDFHYGNVLVAPDGSVGGVIDWDGACRGDQRFDLVTLRFAVPGGRPDLAARLDAELDARLTPDELRPYWASMALRQVDWAIRHYGDELVTYNLAIAETRLAG